MLALRHRMRTTNAVAIVTLPSAAMTPSLVAIADAAIRLESFQGTEAAAHAYFKHVDGLVHVLKRVCLNAVAPPASFLSLHRGDLAFKLYARRFEIAPFVPPPEGDDAQSQDATASGCGSVPDF